MIETNIPEINVDELMEKIRVEVRLRRERGGTLHRTVPRANDAPPSSLYARIDPSKIQAMPDPEPFEYKEQSYHINDFLKYHDQQFVINAYQGILRRGSDSEGLRHFLESLRSGKMTKAEVLGRLRYAPEGRAAKVKVRGLFRNFVTHTSFRIPVLGYLFRLGVGIVNLPTILRNFSHLDATISAQLSDQRDRFNVTVRMSQSKVNEMIDAIEMQQGILDQKIDMEELVTLGKEKADKAGIEMSLNQKADKEDIGQIHEQIRDILRRMGDYKSTIVDQQQRLGLLLEGVPKRLSEPFYKEQWKAITQGESRWLDYFFATFQDTFRGTGEEVRSRLKMYLSLIQKATAGTQRRPVLDLGCGRGEWIEILREEGLFVRGVDNNRVLFEQCLERGMDVVDSDAIEYLQALPAASLGAITAFHLIEHLSFEAMVDLFDEAIRVLRSDGVVIFETPNIRNILVGASDFYRDPSHHRPIFPDTLQFLAQERGLVNTNCYFIQETESGPELIPSEEKQFDILEDYLEVSRDYVFVGYKS